ncbi:MFS transporter [Shewanella salipaludis]|uniref:MFS transporter n=1 Tax=Shewanella salipaludis TaxID=2723052 RepID=A0A972FYP2_9GAMM|nr:MFS transporter [Shewanella salipaludis]NMH65653.1 MFS transporter [Shewanella salipaludis]
MNTTEIQDNAQQILAVTLLVTLISVAGIALPYPILAPLFSEASSPLTQFMQLPPELLLGIVLGIYPLGIIIGSSFIGALSDHLGRKRVLSLTLLGSALGYGLTGLAAASGNFLLFCLARLLTGICEGNIAIARAIATDLHPKIDKLRSFSLISAMGYGGYLLGPLVGGQLAFAGTEVVFYLAALACLVCTLLSHGLLPKALDARVQHADKGSSLVLLKDAQLRRFFLLYLLLTLGVNIYYEFYPLWLVQQQDYSAVGISWATVFLTSCMIATSLMFNPRLQRRFSQAQAGLLGMLLFSLALAMLPASGHFSFLLCFALMGMGIAIYNGFLPAYISTAYEHRAQGQLMGMLVTIFCVGNLLAAIIGSLLSLLAVQWALLVGAITVLLACMVFFHGHFKAGLWQAKVAMAQETALPRH